MIPRVVQLAVLFTVMFLAWQRLEEGKLLVSPVVDSHVCLRAERSPIVHPGCHTNTIEKVGRR